MPTYDIDDAKRQLSQLIEAVQQGESVIIAKAGKLVAELKPVHAAMPKRVRGVLRGQIRLGPEFDEALPKDVVLASFEG